MSTVEEAKKRKHCKSGWEILIETIPSCVTRIQLHIRTKSRTVTIVLDNAITMFNIVQIREFKR